MKKFFGRKFITLVLYGIFTWANRRFGLGLSDQDIISVGGASGLYMISQAWEDKRTKKE